MDVKSILRAFRFGQMQARADRDPDAKQPPTIMFVGLVVAIGLAIVGIALVLADRPPSTPSGGVYEVSDPTPTNETTPPPSDDAPHAKLHEASARGNARWHWRPTTSYV